jgi:hypothetical protein
LFEALADGHERELSQRLAPRLTMQIRVTPWSR